jgi:hypothetical protein
LPEAGTKAGLQTSTVSQINTFPDALPAGR